MWARPLWPGERRDAWPGERMRDTHAHLFERLALPPLRLLELSLRRVPPTRRFLALPSLPSHLVLKLGALATFPRKFGTQRVVALALHRHRALQSVDGALERRC